jgi:2-methylcitrate dehydratase PrpD
MSTTPTLAERLARYAAELRYEQIPPEVVQFVCRLVFDTLGVGLGGYQTALGTRAAAFAAEQMPGDQANLIGCGRRASLEGAAFGNATMIKILGMDDSHRNAGHIAAEVLPAALAMAQHHRTSGRELIAAIVASYDIAVRTGVQIRAEIRRRGIDLKGTVGTLAAAIAAGRCAGLDASALTDAFALAADMAGSTEQYVYEGGPCDTKDLIAGFAARNAVFAARLAAHGFRGPRGALDGAYGFFRAFGDRLDPAAFDDLGHVYAITTTALKPHGGCRHTHQAVDAVQEIRRQADIDPSQVVRIVVQTYQYALEPRFRIDPDPPSREVAGLSIRVTTALALARGSLWPDDLASWDAPEVRRLRHLVEVEVDPEIEAIYPNRNGCRVSVEVRDGRSFEGVVPYARGEPESPLSTDELRAKFSALTRKILSPASADTLYERCLQLPDLANVSVLLEAHEEGMPITDPAG